MELWGRLRQFELGWGGLGLLVLAFLVALWLRRLLPGGRRERGKFSVLLLGCAPVLHLVATGLGLAGAASASAALHLLNIVVVIVAATGLVTMVLFDLVLGRTSVPTILRDFTQVAAFGALVFVVLRVGGLQPLSVLTTSAVATAVIGLALQGIMTNVLAGLVLHFDRTLRLGDLIQWGQRSGTLVEINWRASSIVTRDGDTAIVPNAALLSGEVLNLSRPTRARRTTIRLPVRAEHSPGDVRRVLLGALAGLEGIRTDPAPTCGPVDEDVLSARTLHALRYWIDDASRESAIEEQVRARLWYAVQRGGLQDAPPASPADQLEARVLALSRVVALSTRTDAERRALASGARRKHFAEGERIECADGAGRTLLLVERGSVVAPGETTAFGAGTWLGEGSLLGGPDGAAYVASTEVVCVELDAASLASLLGPRAA